MNTDSTSGGPKATLVRADALGLRGPLWLKYSLLWVFLVIYSSVNIVRPSDLSDAATIILVLLCPAFIIFLLRISQRHWTIANSDGKYSWRRVSKIRLALAWLAIVVTMAVVSTVAESISKALYGNSRPEIVYLFQLFGTSPIPGYLFLLSCILILSVKPDPTLHFVGSVLKKAIYFAWFERKDESAIKDLPVQQGDRYVVPLNDDAHEIARTLQTTGINVPRRAAAIVELRTRAERLKVLNIVLLIMIVVMLIGGAVSIVFAGQISSQDSESVNTLRRLRETYERAKSVRDKLEEVDINLKLSGESPFPEKSRVPEREKPGLILDYAKYRAAQIARAQFEVDQLALLLSEVEKLAYAPKSAAGALEKGPAFGDQDRQLVAASVTRFGILALVLYLVQILVGLYRYNAQLSGQYSAQASALMLIGTQTDGFETLVAAMKPRAAFGKIESSTGEKLLDRLGDGIDAVREKVRPSAPRTGG